jgi:hypothetical protein
MRLWSLHPCYLDPRGLVACWREGLLARKVLQGQTKGYRHHPQLARFQAHREPLITLDSYLLSIFQEAIHRGYAFNREKIGHKFSESKLEVTEGQLEYELCHLKAKLLARDLGAYNKIVSLKSPLPHPLFRVVVGPVEGWEKIVGS